MASPKRSGRRRLYPMPVEALIDDPLGITFPSAAFGMLAKLCLYFWNSECRPIPISDEHIRQIVGAHKPTWRRWNTQILEVFERVRPELESYFQSRETKASTLSRLGQHRTSRLRAAALRENSALAQPAETYEMGFVPKRDGPKASRPPTPAKGANQVKFADRPR